MINTRLTKPLTFI